MRFKKSSVFVGLLISLFVIVIVSCATLFLPAKDSIKVECSKPGVTIYLDGKLAGVTPLVIQVSRKENHVLKVEAEGYITQEVTIERGLNSWGVADIVSMGIAAGTVIGTVAYDYYYLLATGIPSGLMLTFSIVDFLSGNVYDFPETVQIILQ